MFKIYFVFTTIGEMITILTKIQTIFETKLQSARLHDEFYFTEGLIVSLYCKLISRLISVTSNNYYDQVHNPNFLRKVNIVRV